MMRFLVLVIWLAVTLLASYSTDLKNADKLLKSTSKSDVFRAYNSYKNIYIQTLISKDKKFEKKSLQGIINSGKILHIDIKKYQNKLQKLQSKSSENHSKSSKKSLYITDLNFENGLISLSCNKNIPKNSIKYIWFYNKSTKKYVYKFTLNNVSIAKKKFLNIKNIDKVYVDSYKSNNAQLTIINRKKILISFETRKNRLNVRLFKSKKISKNTHVTLTPVAKKEKRYVPTQNKVIVLDPGHGGKDSGAVGYRGYREKVVVLDVAKKLQKILRKRGYTVYMTRSNDTFIDLKKRTRFANKKKADIFISIHANSVPKKKRAKIYGIETYFLSPARSNRAKNAASVENAVEIKNMKYFAKQNFLSIMNSEKIVASHKLAIDLQQGLLSTLKPKYTHIKDAGVREAPFWVLVGAQMPAVLVEIGFISHPMEAKRMVDKNYQMQLANGLADGLFRYLSKNP